MKKVYICGDSFGCHDTEYPGLSWHENLKKKLPDTIELINLSKVCASNLLISLQVDQAITDQADYVVVLCTSVLRDEVKIKEVANELPLIKRFVDITVDKNNNACDLISYTMLNINQDFLESSTDILRSYFLLKDLNLLIYKDQCIIENTLQKLVDNNIPFTFDQGGFENPTYGSVNKQYFQKFKNYLSEKNIWSHVPVRFFRPYYHLVDHDTTNNIADYYHKLIIEKLQ
jgi:hypothetical protein